MKRVVKKRAKALQKAFDSEKLIQKMIKDVSSPYKIKMIFHYIFSYYLCSMDKRCDYSYDEIITKLSELCNSGKEIIEQRYYFKAFNGVYEETFRNNGLDDISDLDPKLIEAMEILESELGKSGKLGYTSGGKTNGNNWIFVTTDPLMLMDYALFYSPERLWKGPLGDENNIAFCKLPIEVGENKTEYMMRIIESKIEGKNNEEKEMILQAGQLVCEAYGSKRPKIAIIPESVLKDYEANYNGYNSYDGWKKNLIDLAQDENPSWTYNLDSGPNFRDAYGIAILGKIESDKYLTITVPDYFELAQIYAIQRGANLGDLIDPVTCEIIEKAKSEERLPIIKSERIIDKLMMKLKNLSKKNPKQKDEDSKMKFEDLRKNKFRWNWRNAFMCKSKWTRVFI